MSKAKRKVQRVRRAAFVATIKGKPIVLPAHVWMSRADTRMALGRGWRGAL